jgi:predicted nucleic acid-binding protein
MIVVDSNVLAYLYLPVPYTAAAEALLARSRLGRSVRYCGTANFATFWLNI